MANTKYSLWLYNKNDEAVLLIQDFVKLEYAKRVNQVGAFDILLPGDAIPTSYTDLTDWKFVVWREPTNVVKYVDFAGFVRSWDRFHDGNVSRIRLVGVDYNDLLDRRIVAYRSTTSQSDKGTDYADDMAKAFVRENLGASATDADRDVTGYGFSVQGDLSACTQVSKAAAFRNLLTTLNEISESSLSTESTAMYFGVVPTVNGITMEFRTNVQQWGLDHRYPSGGAGAVIFALERGNMREPNLEIDRRDEVTAVYGGGRGEGTARELVETEDTARIGASNYNRREQFYDGRMAENTTVLTSAARSVLEKGKPTRSFTFDVQDAYTSTGTPATVYGSQWGFGDYITASYAGAQYDLHVAAVAVTVDNYGELVTGVLEEVAQ